MAQRVDVLLQRVVVDAAEAKRQLDQYGSKATTTADKVKRKNVGLGKSYDQLRASINKIAIRLGVATVAFIAIKKAMDRAREVNNLGRAFGTLTTRIGETSDVMLGKMRAASRGFLTDTELMKQANTAIQLGLPVTADSMAELTEAALKLGRSMGVDAKRSLESLTVGIGRQSRLWLDNLGIIVDVERANLKYAESLGKSVKELTDADKKMAFYNETLVKAREATKGLNLETADAVGLWDRAKVSVTNFADELAGIVGGVEAGGIGEVLFAAEAIKLQGLLDAAKAIFGPEKKNRGATRGFGDAAEERAAAETAALAAAEQERLATQDQRIAGYEAEIAAIHAQFEEWAEIDRLSDPGIEQGEVSARVMQHEMDWELILAAEAEGQHQRDNLELAGAQQRVKYAEWERQQKVQQAMMVVSMLGGALSTLFNDNKIAAIANTIVNTAQGVMAAMALGPAGIPIAVIIAAAGAANIAKIQSTEIGSGGSAPSAPAISPISSPGGFGGGGGGQTVHIFIEGTGFIQDTSEFARTISQAIEEQRAQAGIN